MSNSDISKKYIECKNYVDSIMNDIKELLRKRKIRFTSNGNYQIEITSKKTIDDIKKVLKSLNVEKDILKMIISIIEIDGKVIISQRLKN